MSYQVGDKVKFMQDYKDGRFITAPKGEVAEIINTRPSFGGSTKYELSSKSTIGFKYWMDGPTLDRHVVKTQVSEYKIEPIDREAFEALDKALKFDGEMNFGFDLIQEEKKSAPACHCPLNRPTDDGKAYHTTDCAWKKWNEKNNGA